MNLTFNDLHPLGLVLGCNSVGGFVDEVRHYSTALVFGGEFSAIRLAAIEQLGKSELLTRQIEALYLYGEEFSEPPDYADADLPNCSPWAAYLAASFRAREDAWIARMARSRPRKTEATS